jgi:hypothetical protein
LCSLDVLAPHIRLAVEERKLHEKEEVAEEAEPIRHEGRVAGLWAVAFAVAERQTDAAEHGGVLRDLHARHVHLEHAQRLGPGVVQVLCTEGLW